MQVKKFEAKTMKEALELVKASLGPEAIILSAKDNTRGFGLVGHTSVEVTAAVSEETLRKKQIAETKLREELKRKFHQIPASQQKQFINKVFEPKPEPKVAMAVSGGGYITQARQSAPLRPEELQTLKGMRYIDIADEAPPIKETSSQRVRSAVQRARDASLEVLAAPAPKKRTGNQRSNANRTAANGLETVTQPAPAPQAMASTPHAATNSSIAALENQIGELRSLIEKFQKMPQVPLNVHAGAEQGVPFQLSPIYAKLTGQGIQAEIVLSLIQKAQKEMDPESLKKPALVDAFMVQQLMTLVEVVKNPTAARYQIFMGCTGQGKTTTLVKLASQLVLKERKKIAIVSMDTFKVGAADQLRIYAQILNVPFAVVKSPEEWKVAEQKLAHVQHILVDCPGFNLQAYSEVEWLRQMMPPAHLSRSIHFVQSALVRDVETLDVASRYNMIGFHDVIFTRLDEASSHGILVNFQQKFRVPIHSFGTGPKVPEDYEWATKERVVDLIFKLSKASRKEGSHE